MQSPNRWREKVPGMKEAGAMSFEFNFVPGGAAIARLMNLFNASSSSQLRVRWHNSSPANDLDVVGYVSNIAPETPLAEIMTATAEVTITGAVNYWGS